MLFHDLLQINEGHDPQLGILDALFIVDCNKETQQPFKNPILCSE
jgi:hypothetical protein